MFGLFLDEEGSNIDECSLASLIDIYSEMTVPADCDSSLDGYPRGTTYTPCASSKFIALASKRQQIGRESRRCYSSSWLCFEIHRQLIELSLPSPLEKDMEAVLLLNTLLYGPGEIDNPEP